MSSPRYSRLVICCVCRPPRCLITDNSVCVGTSVRVWLSAGLSVCLCPHVHAHERECEVGQQGGAGKTERERVGCVSIEPLASTDRHAAMNGLLVFLSFLASSLTETARVRDGEREIQEKV